MSDVDEQARLDVIRAQRRQERAEQALQDRIDRRCALAAASGGAASPAKIVEKAEILLAWLKGAPTA
jgi:hypothetical protein